MVLVLMIQRSCPTTTKSGKRWMILKNNKLKKGFPSIGILPKEGINEAKYFFINCWEFDAYWSTFFDDS